MIEDKITLIKELIKDLNIYTEAYDKGKPVISDTQWNNMYFKLQELEKETGIIYPNSPTQSIHYKVVSELQKKEHEYKPMLSLDKTKSPKEVQSFVSGHEWCAMFKLDGLSCRLTYVNGVLVGAETRGDGEIGENILHNAKVISNIPKQIPYDKKDDSIIIDGEIICDIDTFEKYFANEYKNPRNLAAGSIRLLDAKESASRKLKFVAWDLIKGCEDIDFFFWRLEKLDDWGFETVPRVGDAETVEDAIKILDRMKKDTIYPIDGYVFRFESQEFYESLGRTEHHFNGAYSLKFYDEEYETELLNIELSLGRTGVLTPIAIFKPIEIDGTIVERASLHNYSVLVDTLGKYPDLHQTIWVAKMNMIIPQITRAIKNDIPHDHVIFDINNAYCPICGQSVEIVTSESGVKNLMCVNDNCEGKLSTRIEHYLGKKGLNVKGISKATIQKLIDWGWINHIKDIYELERYREEWEQKPGFGKASVAKILSAIEQTGRQPKLDSFISALGIPLVGTRASQEITKYYSTWKDFRNAIGSDWTAIEGFGPEINAAINNFDYTEADKIVSNYINFQELKVSNNEQNDSAKGLTFCITGKVNIWKNRNELKSYIESIGGRVVGSISSKVNYLINNDATSTTSKNLTAQKNGIPIITESQFQEMFGQN